MEWWVLCIPVNRYSQQTKEVVFLKLADKSINFKITKEDKWFLPERRVKELRISGKTDPQSCHWSICIHIALKGHMKVRFSRQSVLTMQNSTHFAVIQIFSCFVLWFRKAVETFGSPFPLLYNSRSSVKIPWENGWGAPAWFLPRDPAVILPRLFTGIPGCIQDSFASK